MLPAPSQTQVLCNTRVVRAEDGSYSMPSGESHSADVSYMTVGGLPNTDFLKGSIVPLTERNRIQARRSCGVPCWTTGIRQRNVSAAASRGMQEPSPC